MSPQGPTKIPFNKPYLTGQEIPSIIEAHSLGQLSGDGTFTKRCHEWLQRTVGSKHALLTHSCTAALEMSALLADLKAGDEVIMPSYTFVSTANAFCLRGAVPVFVDIRPDTLNIDERLIESAITDHTRAICVVHYAGVGCEMALIEAVARRHNLILIEDAAQALQSSYRGRCLGTFGALAALSFHETKNIISGEGGALLINDARHVERAEIVREKGTNRSKFFRGQVDKYTWCDIGSSYLPGEVIAAFLHAQMLSADAIKEQRLELWNRYHQELEPLEQEGRLRRPVIPSDCEHNAHMYYILLRNLAERTRFIEHMRSQGILCVFHYVPLHSSPAGLRFGRVHGEMANTNSYSERIVRLPLWIGLDEHMDHVVESVRRFFR